ncbi:nephrin-like [Tetranychus urticae]|uniref:nephrin-like n=1 Tax=Tetranychus urticae TaxID=32264 RepID=UPI00077C0058|nr:nephrin-like [Tetranychus urticae]
MNSECKIILLCRVFKLKTMWILILPSYLFLCSLNYNLVESQNLEIDYSGHIEVEAIAGKSVSLPCNISITHGNSREVAIILWYKDDTGIPVYTVDIRNKSSLSSSIHLPSSSYKSRSYFEMSKSPPTLRLDKIESKDSGEYRCRVDYEKYPTQNFLVNLTVIVPPKSVTITDSNGTRLEGVIGPYLRGTTLHLICKATGGDPSPSIRWWKGGDMIDDTYQVINNQTVVNEYILENIDRNNLLTVLTCLVSNTDLIPPKEISVSIDMILEPLGVELLLPSDYLPANKKSDLICLSYGSRPPVQVTWLKDDKPLNATSTETVSDDGNSTVSRYQFIPSIEDNGKSISCSVINLKLSTSTSLQDQNILNIHFVPQVSIVLGASLQLDSIRENTDVYFECNIRANPWVNEVTWLFQDTPLYTDPLAGIIVANQSLVLQRVKRQQRGYYQCSAFNSQGTGFSEKVYLKINFSPICKSNQRLTYGVSRNESVRILCEVESDPVEVKFKWIFNNSHESHVITNVTSNGTKSVALYEPKSRFDYGSVICQAENSAGIQKDPCIFNIIAAGPPSPVRACSAYNTTSSSFLVKCDPGDSGGLKQTFTIQVYDTGHNLIFNQSSLELPIFWINNLHSSTPYKVNIYSTNFKGKSKSVNLTGLTLPNPQKQQSKEADQGSIKDQIMGILLSIAGGLIVVTILIALIIKQRKTSYTSCRSQVTSDYPKNSPRIVENESYLPDISRTNNLEKSFYAIDSVKNPIATFDCIAVAKNELAKYNIQADATSIISSTATSKADHGTESFMWSNEAPNNHIHLQTNYGQNIYSANYQPNSPANASPLNYDSMKRIKFQPTCIQTVPPTNSRVALNSPIQPIIWDTSFTENSPCEKVHH